MKRSELLFERPEGLAAIQPAETAGRSRDSGRLLVSTSEGHRHACFSDLAHFLNPGDLLVVNRSATIPASLPAESEQTTFTLNLSTQYGDRVWLAEPRISSAETGPVPGLGAGSRFTAGGIQGRLLRPYPGLDRLWFVRFESDIWKGIHEAGRPIRYGYVQEPYGLQYYQTIFAHTPGSAEMPSAAYPFTRQVLQSLRDQHIDLASIVLHTGVSSLEVEVDEVEDHPLYPEPYMVPAVTVNAVNQAKKEGRRVIALGTTVVRALETAWDGSQLRPASGFTRLYIHPQQGVRVTDGLLTGLHDPVTSHLAMLYTIGGKQLIQEGYAEAVKEGYRWHEFGDSHLIIQ